MRVRTATPEDLPALGEIQVAAKAFLADRYVPEVRDQHPGDPAAFVPLGEHLLETGTLVLAEDEEPAGFAAAIVRDGAWYLSQLWVHPDRHGAGIGARLLDEALTVGRGASRFAVVSSPAPAAVALYLRRSMFPLWPWYQFDGAAEPPEVAGGFEPLTEADDGWVGELDREVLGWARPEDHAWWRRRAEGYALRREGVPSGYVYAWPDGRVGPAAAVNPADVAGLLARARAAAGGAVWMIVPAANRVALTEAVRLGLRLRWTNTFMASRPMGDPSRYLSGGGALA